MALWAHFYANLNYSNLFWIAACAHFDIFPERVTDVYTLVSLSGVTEVFPASCSTHRRFRILAFGFKHVHCTVKLYDTTLKTCPLRFPAVGETRTWQTPSCFVSRQTKELSFQNKFKWMNVSCLLVPYSYLYSALLFCVVITFLNYVIILSIYWCEKKNNPGIIFY